MSVSRDWEKNSSQTTVEEKLMMSIAENIKLNNEIRELNKKYEALLSVNEQMNNKLETELHKPCREIMMKLEETIVNRNAEISLLREEVEQLKANKG